MPQNAFGVKLTWFRQWLGAVKQQAIARVSVDLDICRQATMS